ncbi:MAG: hypothetical protein KKA73_10930 [Chloroflexi bacterium]|nr:hypothetical protein [Chloroflexota bacterium]MBU1748190.1 hypothetical protein [Chloroflexota bacterium]
MGLGVFFAQDLQHAISGLDQAATDLTQAWGTNEAHAERAAYLAGYRAALRAVATSLGLGQIVALAPTSTLAVEPYRWELPRPVYHDHQESEP